MAVYASRGRGHGCRGDAVDARTDRSALWSPRLHVPLAAQMEGWQTWHRQAPDGAIESEQRVALTRPVVEFSTAGAERLGRSYWREVRRLTGSLVRPRERGGALELRLLGGPVLLRFDRPTLEASETRAFCSYPIAGGLLARRAAGELSSSRPPARSARRFAASSRAWRTTTGSRAGRTSPSAAATSGA